MSSVFVGLWGSRSHSMISRRSLDLIWTEYGEAKSSAIVRIFAVSDGWYGWEGGINTV